MDSKLTLCYNQIDQKLYLNSFRQRKYYELTKNNKPYETEYNKKANFLLKYKSSGAHFCFLILLRLWFSCWYYLYAYSVHFFYKLYIYKQFSAIVFPSIICVCCSVSKFLRLLEFHSAFIALCFIFINAKSFARAVKSRTEAIYKRIGGHIFHISLYRSTWRNGKSVLFDDDIYRLMRAQTTATTIEQNWTKYNNR